MEVLRKARMDNSLMDFFPQQARGPAPACMLCPLLLLVAFASRTAAAAPLVNLPAAQRASLHSAHCSLPPWRLPLNNPSPQKRNWADFEAHFEAAGLHDLVAFSKQKLYSVHCQVGGCRRGTAARRGMPPQRPLLEAGPRRLSPAVPPQRSAPGNLWPLTLPAPCLNCRLPLQELADTVQGMVADDPPAKPDAVAAEVRGAAATWLVFHLHALGATPVPLRLLPTTSGMRRAPSAAAAAATRLELCSSALICVPAGQGEEGGVGAGGRRRGQGAPRLRPSFACNCSGREELGGAGLERTAAQLLNQPSRIPPGPPASLADPPPAAPAAPARLCPLQGFLTGLLNSVLGNIGSKNTQQVGGT